MRVDKGGEAELAEGGGRRRDNAAGLGPGHCRRHFKVVGVGAGERGAMPCGRVEEVGLRLVPLSGAPDGHREQHTRVGRRLGLGWGVQARATVIRAPMFNQYWTPFIKMTGVQIKAYMCIKRWGNWGWMVM